MNTQPSNGQKHIKEYFLEFIMLFLAISLGFFAENYREQMNEKENMTVFLTTHYMDEAEKMADRIAIIDHGEIKRIGTPAEIKKQTNSKTIEEAFLKLTGHQIREETASARDRMRVHRAAWGGRR